MKTTATEWVNLVMWILVLAASIVLLWGSDRTWMMVIVILGAGSASYIAVARALHKTGGLS